MEQLFKECCDFIDAEYQRLDHTLGYRFLTCSHTLLNPDIKLLYLDSVVKLCLPTKICI